MGRVASKITKPIRTFNIENRAARELQKQDVSPKAAPKHQSTEEAISQLQYAHPEYLEAQQMKNEALHENLKKIYVDTQDAPIEIKPTSKPLPTSRKSVQDSDLGIMDVEYQIPEGRIDLKTLLGLISQHQLEPHKISAQYIAEQHKLDEEEVKNVLRYFKSLQLHLPQNMYKENPKLKKLVVQQISQSTSSGAPFQISSSETEQKKIRQENMTEPSVKP